MMAQLEKRVTKLERKVAEIERKLLVKAPKSIPSKGLPARILELRNSRFFVVPKIDAEVHKKLESDKYYCELNRVSMALFRLAKKNELRKASKIVEGKTRIAYVW